MKRIFKSLFIFILIVGCLFLNISTPLAMNAYVSEEREDTKLDTIKEKIPTNLGQVDYLNSSDSPIDHLKYFTGDRAGWQPRTKYTGGDPTNIASYVFCLSHHKTAPNKSITYTRDTKLDGYTDLTNIPDEWFAYAYIIENGFGMDFSTEADPYATLKWQYYITSMALWQYQFETGKMDHDTGFVSIESFENNDEKTYKAITALVQGAKDLSSDKKTKFVVPYNPNNNDYQVVTPNIIYQINKKGATLHYYCSIIGTDYYDKAGNKVSKEEFNASCNPVVEPYTPPTPKRYSCEIVNGIYYDAKGNGVTKEIYENSCGIEKKKEPEPYTPQPEPKEENPETAVDSYLYAGLGLAGLIPTYLYLRKKKKFIKIK